MDKSFRIKANVGEDQVINVQLKRDIDLYEILSLKLSQKNMYRRHSADYGVIVGRVLANDAFGVPNAKVSVFIPLSAKDELRNDLSVIYPYKDSTDVNSRKVRYNLLPNYKRSSCHNPVGTFPKKQLVLDNDSVLEIFDKYYRYTTVTNQAGDYMIFGVPTGNHIIHVDVDLSDIGVLSQKPRDFVYKGYSIDLFNSPTQFKSDTNLDNLPQILTQNISVNVYPFWGDKDTNEIAITRKDINLQYKFETTCVFMGSVMTDNGSNSISHICVPDEQMGDASQLVPSEGIIEMIRKTGDGRVEEYAIKGNRLIDSDGVFCYQIPMNLDYVGMDEYGNIVPTDNPNKGIPTRTRVRFRFTLNENGETSLTRHKARYLVPNNPDLYEGGNITQHTEPRISESFIGKGNSAFYEFGSKTPDSCYRDLYWNKVYSVKGYIPRVQKSEYDKTTNYLAIKNVNKKGARNHNIIPYNKINLNIPLPAYQMIYNAGVGNRHIAGYWNYLRTKYMDYNIDAIREDLLEEMDAVGLDFYNDWLNGCLYFPSWFWYVRMKDRYDEGELAYDSQFCECESNGLQNEEMMGGLYLYNTCSLVYNNNDLEINTTTGNNGYTSEDKLYHKFNFGTFKFDGGIIKKMTNKNGGEIFYYAHGNMSTQVDEVNRDSRGWYELPADKNIVNDNTTEKVCSYARLFATDIILLGSLNENDIDDVPQMQFNFPSSTANIPPMGAVKADDKDKLGTFSDDNSKSDYKKSDDELLAEIKEVRPSGTTGYAFELETNYNTVNGMHWGQYWETHTSYFGSEIVRYNMYNYNLKSGLFFGIGCIRRYKWDWVRIGYRVLNNIFGFGNLWANKFRTEVKKTANIEYRTVSDRKTCVNIDRICELGVTLDSDMEVKYYDESGNTYTIASKMDGLINKKELIDMDSRALFATLNSNRLIGMVDNPFTGYKKYKLDYFYPTDFDGRLRYIASAYTNSDATDFRNLDYLDFRFGSHGAKTITKGNITDNDETSIGYEDYISKTEYKIGSDGEISFKTTYSPKNRHFYGAPSAITQSYYAFPMYENSFYFFFGMNNGSTAMDKLRSNFFSYCPETKTLPSTLKIETTKFIPCDGYAKIVVTVGDIEKPYTAKLERKEVSTPIEVKNSEIGNEVIFDAPGQGTYTVTITDANGTSVVEVVEISVDAVALNVIVSKHIGTKYKNQSNCDICNNTEYYYGEIKFNSWTIGNATVPINSITSLSINGNTAYFLAETNLDGKKRKVKIALEVNSGNITDYICSCPTVPNHTDNKINISKPGIFKARITEICDDDKETSNTHAYDIIVRDSNGIDLIINDLVPVRMLMGELNNNTYENSKFYDSNGYNNDNNASKTKSWISINNPNVYSSLFTNGNGDEWRESYDAKSNFKTRFSYLFSLCNSTYVTSDKQTTIKVGLDNDGTSTTNMISSYPIYNKFTDSNNVKGNQFDLFETITGSTTLTAVTSASNIIGKNNRYVEYTDGNNSIPSDAIVTAYGYNQKYNGVTNGFCGNYFAAFSNNFDLDDNCNKINGPYQRMPYRANDLSSDRFCTSGYYFNEMKIGVTRKQGNDYPHFVTEFVDRRFDYDLLFITPYSASTNLSWSVGRLSGVTYNGIEMAIDNSGSIISPNGPTEYRYDAGSMSISLYDGVKYFKESYLKYAKGEQINLLKAYRYSKNTAPSGEPSDKNVNLTFVDSKEVATNGNFSEENYPSVRSLDFYGIPYGDEYEYKTTSYSYKGIDIVANDNIVSASPTNGESVSLSFKINDTIKISDITVYYKLDSSTYKSNSIDMKVTANTESSSYYRTKIETNGGYGIRVIGDDSNHTKLSTIKTGSSFNIIDNTIKSNTKFNIGNDNDFSTYNLTNKVFNVNDGSCSDAETLIVLADVHYYNNLHDSLTKKLRVLNTINIINVPNIGISYRYVKEHKTIESVDIDINISFDYTNADGDTVTAGGSDSDSDNVTTSLYHEFTFTLSFPSVPDLKQITTTISNGSIQTNNVMNKFNGTKDVIIPNIIDGQVFDIKAGLTARFTIMMNDGMVYHLPEYSFKKS